MPAIVPACWLLAMICTAYALHWPRRWTRDQHDWTKLTTAFVALGFVIGALGYPITAIILRDRPQVKKAAAEINSLVPANETLYAVDPDNQPVFFYLNAPVQYVSHIKNLPANTHYFVVQTNEQVEATTTKKFFPRCTHPIARIHTHGQRAIILFKVEA
jgi:hypothetical protein